MVRRMGNSQAVERRNQDAADSPGILVEERHKPPVGMPAVQGIQAAGHKQKALEDGHNLAVDNLVLPTDRQVAVDRSSHLVVDTRHLLEEVVAAHNADSKLPFVFLARLLEAAVDSWG